MVDRRSNKRSNLRDVAKAAGVSIATVSRVLNSPDIVSAETRRRVMETIEELHFVPSAAARAINSGRTKMVGALVPTLDNAIFAKFLAALEARLGEGGLSLIVATTDGDPDIEARKAQGLVDIGAEALIVSGVTHSHAFDELIRRARIPAIATSYYDEHYSLPTIGYDNAATSLIALEFLRSEGHRSVGIVHGPVSNNDRTRARLAGLEKLATDVTMQAFETTLSIEGGVAAAREFLKAQTSCTAILCLSDVLAMGTILELQRNNVRLPDEISLMGIDDLPYSSFSNPEITTVHLPVSRMGAYTADAVIQWLDNDIVPKSKLIEAQLIVRQSTKKYRGREQ
ncbi:MAG: LacI family DNA-binding transcriptional regulator [Pseudomonadota bacterium]